jgi:predicted PurR-regulated permease PerM
METTGRGPLASAVAVWIVAAVAVLFLLRAASQLLIPIVFAVLISYVLEPLVGWLAHHHVPRLVGASVLMVIISTGAGWAIYSLRDDVTTAVETLPEAAGRVRQWISSKISTRAVALAPVSRTPPEQRAAPRPADSPSIVSGVLSAIQIGLSSVFTLAGSIVTVFFLVFFLLVSGQRLRARVFEVIARDDGRQQLTRIMGDVDRQVQRFLIVRLITAALVAVATWLALTWMGVAQAALWGTLAGIFNSIPYFGPIIVSGGLFFVGLLQGDVTYGLQIAGIALAITTLEGWLVTPPLLGRAEGMSALTVFLGLLLWTWIWGPWGTILAVPMLVIIKAVADHTPTLKPLGRLMAP